MQRKPPRPKMSQVAHSALVIQRSFRRWKKRKENKIKAGKGEDLNSLKKKPSKRPGPRKVRFPIF